MRLTRFELDPARYEVRRRSGECFTWSPALPAREFDDTIRFTPHPTPRRAEAAFAVLRPLARMRGPRSSYPQYDRHWGGFVEDLEPLPPHITALMPPPAGQADVRSPTTTTE